eukprot:4592854-Prymnesium_polylepis.2
MMYPYEAFIHDEFNPGSRLFLASQSATHKRPGIKLDIKIGGRRISVFEEPSPRISVPIIRPLSLCRRAGKR